jgi:hypothetical protein
MRKRAMVAVVVLVILLAGIGIGAAYASIPGPDGVIHGCYKNSNGSLIVIDHTASCPAGHTALNWRQGLPPGTIYDTVSVVGSYQHDQGSPDKIVTCPDSRVVISGWAFAGNDIPLPVVLNDSSQLKTSMEIHVAGSGSGPWPTSPGQIAQGESVFHGMICARVSA